MKSKRSITFTESEFYEALRRYVLEETGLELPKSPDDLTMLSDDPEQRSLTLEWQDEIKSRPNKES